MPFLTLIGGFLVKLLGSGIVAPVLDYLGKRSDNGVLTNGQNVTGDVTVAQAQLTAYVEERKAIAQERARWSDHPLTGGMIPCAFYLCMVHFGAIVLDSTFRFNWQVAKLPAPYDAMENAIVLSVIGVAGIAPTVRRIFTR
ncbi:hypothetical protein [Methylobacterium brachiatum]|uniref:hypothetical protein n=1 Tax=Methylobacterium brachiatum TaxID=269660 RepID=UPI000EFD0899|nr:hypothetical protein [Methylobacterium brachiatum]AYO85314.1 hypothetical protein EBB05_25885 [Methylobacterium brachiatum]